MSDEQGAFVEMLAASLNAVEKAQIRLGDLVVIYGPGPVGLSMVQLAKASGGRVVIVGTRDYRLELAKGMGAEHAFNIADTASPYYTRRPGRLDPRGQRGRARPTRRSSQRPPRTRRRARSTSPATARRSSTWASPARTTSSSCRCSRASPWTRRSASPGSTPTSGRTRSGCCARASSTRRRSSPTRSRSSDIDAGIRQVVARDDGVIKIIVKP